MTTQQNTNLESDIVPNLSEHKTLNTLLEDIKNDMLNIIKWVHPEQGNQKFQDDWLDTFNDMLKKIEPLKNTVLPPKDMAFLALMEKYYHIVSYKTTLPIYDYKKYLRIARDNLWIFYLSCVLDNSYDLKKNPLRIEISEILSICNFIDKNFKNTDWTIDRAKYLDEYNNFWGSLKFVQLFTEAKEHIFKVEKEHLNIPLLIKIFDLKNEYSKAILVDILHEDFGYTKEEVTDFRQKYKAY